MILTGSEIILQRQQGQIVIEPFDQSFVNSNSIDYCIGSELKKFVSFDGQKAIFKSIDFPEEGIVLDPHEMYLGHTLETIGSYAHTMSLVGRSSLGRLGLFLQVSADLGHVTTAHQWTLELVATKSLRIYPGMRIGQVSFWENQGELKITPKTYACLNGAQENQSH